MSKASNTIPADGRCLLLVFLQLSTLLFGFFWLFAESYPGGKSAAKARPKYTATSDRHALCFGSFHRAAGRGGREHTQSSQIFESCWRVTRSAYLTPRIAEAGKVHWCKPFCRIEEHVVLNTAERRGRKQKVMRYEVIFFHTR